MACTRLRQALHIVLLFFTCLSCAAGGTARQRAPLPLDLVAARQSGIDTTRVEFSPDGKLIAYTEVSGEALDPESTGTGVPPPLGQRSRVVIVDTHTGARSYPSGAQSWSWAPKWSPDGRRLAFYSDEDGQSRLWIWNKDARQAAAIAELAVRPANRSELVQWTADSRSVILRVRPTGSDETQSDVTPAPAATNAEKTGVTVLRTRPASSHPEMRMARNASEAADLVEFDLSTRAVETIARDSSVSWVQVSPDDRYISYARPSMRPFIRPNGSFVAAYFDVVLHDRKKGGSRTLLEHLALNPSGCNWSPNARYLACVPYRPAAMSREANTNQVLIVAVATGESRRLATNLTVIAATSSGSPPSVLWQADALAVYVVGSDAPPSVPAKWYNESRYDRLWRADLSGADAVPVTNLPDQTITGVFSADGRTLWSERGARTAWVFAKDPAMKRGIDALTGLYRVGLQEGTAERKLDLSTSWPADAGAAAAANIIGYTADTLFSPAELWVFDLATQRPRQITHLNAEWEKYDLGSTHLLKYRDVDGRPLRAGLLLPPGYRRGKRVPLVVTVYGLARDATLLNNFGVHGVAGINNMHVLSTRGYAVLTPDMPLRQGIQLKDVFATVMPAVDAAVAEGFVDPERLAIVGYSFGAYTALGLIEQTHRFKAAAINGISMFPDLFTDYLMASYRFSAGNPHFYDDIAPYGLGMNGDPWAHRGRYVDNSIASFFDKIETPVLMAQGTNDGLGSSGAIFGSLRALQKDVEYRVYDNEDHAISRPENIVDLWQRRIEFFDERLNIARNAREEMLFDGERARGRDALTQASQ